MLHFHIFLSNSQFFKIISNYMKVFQKKQFRNWIILLADSELRLFLFLLHKINEGKWIHSPSLGL